MAWSGARTASPTWPAWSGFSRNACSGSLSGETPRLGNVVAQGAAEVRPQRLRPLQRFEGPAGEGAALGLVARVPRLEQEQESRLLLGVGILHAQGTRPFDPAQPRFDVAAAAGAQPFGAAAVQLGQPIEGVLRAVVELYGTDEVLLGASECVGRRLAAGEGAARD